MRSGAARLARALLCVLGGLALTGLTGCSTQPAALNASPTVEVYKSEACLCCEDWITHLKKHGFVVRAINTEELEAIKVQHGVPEALRSCHTALVGGYIVEGHVPAEDVQRMLRDRPEISGIAVAGMPIGSPGMEVEGYAPKPFDVIAFDRSGETYVFASHNPQ